MEMQVILYTVIGLLIAIALVEVYAMIKCVGDCRGIVKHLRTLDSIYMEQLTELEDNLELIKKATKQLTGKEAKQ